MIRRLKRKVITLAMTAVCVLLLLVVTGMNVVNFASVTAEADTTLALLSHNRGRFPEMKNPRPGFGNRPFSPELPYESRYFSVVLDARGQVLLTDTGMVASIDPEAAALYAQNVMQTGKIKGFIGDYRFHRVEEAGDVRIVFLDCGRKLDSFYSFLQSSLLFAFCGMGIAFLVIFFCAGRIVAPIAQSYEKQKRFITDAGHELKTPLTIISANVDILEMELEQPSESLADIRQQTRRLTKLTNDLVMLARMEETGEKMPMIDFPLSEVIQEAAQPFGKLAQAQGKTFTCQIQPNLTLRGNAEAMEQLVSVLLENAVKYTPESGKLRLTLEQSGKNLYLQVCNETQAPLSGADCSHLFDRFYRTDASRNSETGGHGIGLSVAQAVVSAHGGKLQASWDEAQGFRIRAWFPL